MKPSLKFLIAIAIFSACCSALAQGTVHFSLADNFINRSPLFEGATNFFMSGYLSNATSEAGEPFIDNVSSGQTVWGTWTSPSNGIVTLSANATTFSPLLTVYAGSAPIFTGVYPNSLTTPSGDFANLSLIASNNYLACYEHADCGCHWRERNEITFHVVSGQAYQICVDSAIITDAYMGRQSVPVYTNHLGQIIFALEFKVFQTTNIPAGGNVQLELQFTPAPQNDDFERRTRIQGSRVNFAASNAGASKQSGEPDHLGNPGGSSVWYSWLAPASGRVTLSINEVSPYAPPSAGNSFGSSFTEIIAWGPDCGNLIDQNPPPIFYPVFAAYTGTTLASLTPANCLPAALDAFPNMVEFDAVRGQTYQIAFDGNRGTTGYIPFYLALTPPAINNNFEHRIALQGIYAEATGYNAGATHQMGEPVFGNSSGKTVWWSWTAPVSGTVSVDLNGSDYSFPLAVFTGSAVARLQMIAEDSGGVSFDAIAGHTYQIAIGDSTGLTGIIHLKLQAPIVELVLTQISGSRNNARLSYAATAGQIILLQQSSDGVNWRNLQKMVAAQSVIQFLVRPAPTDNGPYYRAVIVDRIFN